MVIIWQCFTEKMSCRLESQVQGKADAASA